MDGDSAVERQPVIEVVFSTDVDAASVTSDSFSLVGPAGEVAGTLDVLGASVTFEPAEPLWLLGDYTLKVSTDVVSTDGVALAAASSADFQVRDGVFGTPKRISASGGPNMNVVGSRSGHVGVSWAAGSTMPRSFVVAIFDPITAAWGDATEVEADTQADYSFGSVALNNGGEAFAVMGNTAGAWNRFDGSTWGTARTDGLSQTRSVALADNGMAMTIWSEYVGEVMTVFTAAQSRAGAWSIAEPLDSNARTWGIQQYGAGFLALIDRASNDAVYARIYEPGTGWLAAKPVTPANANANYVSLATTEGAALFTWWDASNVMKASAFDGSVWTIQALGPVSGGTKAAASPAGLLAAWISSTSVYAARYDGNGWADPVKLGPTNAEYGIGAEIDGLGNALVAWPSTSNIAWRRLAGGAWSTLHQLEDQDPGIVFSVSDPSGNVVLVWGNPLGVWASRFE